jgi:hypothetical protein
MLCSSTRDCSRSEAELIEKVHHEKNDREMQDESHGDISYPSVSSLKIFGDGAVPEQRHAANNE